VKDTHSFDDANGRGEVSGMKVNDAKDVIEAAGLMAGVDAREVERQVVGISWLTSAWRFGLSFFIRAKNAFSSLVIEVLLRCLRQTALICSTLRKHGTWLYGQERMGMV
jgi:hypothetical protein